MSTLNVFANSDRNLAKPGPLERTTGDSSWEADWLEGTLLVLTKHTRNSSKTTSFQRQSEGLAAMKTMAKLTELGRGSEPGWKHRPSDSDPEWLRQEMGRQGPLPACSWGGWGLQIRNSLERKKRGQRRPVRMCGAGNRPGWDFPWIPVMSTVELGDLDWKGHLAIV